MNDIFNEQLVARKPNKKDTLQKIGIAAIGALLIVAALNIPVMGGFVFIVIGAIVAGAVFLMRRYNVEYEYVFTNGDLDIDRITNRSSRKNAISVNVKSFVTMVPMNRKEYEREVSNYSKLYDFSSGVVGEETYAVIFEQDRERIKMIFEPNEQMFNAIRMYIPRIIKK